jgi:hypothetical protein
MTTNKKIALKGDITLKFTTQCRISVEADKEDYEDYHRTYSSSIYLTKYDDDGNEEEEIDIGYVEAWYIDGSRAIDNNLDIFEARDAI